MRVTRFLALCAAIGACVGDSNVPPPDGGGPDATVDAPPADVVSEPVATGPIHGTVIYMNGGPMAGAHVDIGGADLVTDSTGAFATATDPGPTYDAVLEHTASGTPVPLYAVFHGLTRRYVTLMAVTTPSFEFTSTLDGTAKNALPTVANVLAARLAFSGNNAALPIGVGDAGGFGLPTFAFYPNAPQPGTLYLFEQTKNDAGAVVGYPYFGTQTGVTLVDGGSFVASINSSSVTAGNITVSYALPSGTGFTTTTSIYAAVGSNENALIDQSTAPSGLVFPVPNVGTTFKFLTAVAAYASTGGFSTAWDLVGAGANPSFTLPNLPVITGPTAGSFAVASQAITYTGPAGVYLVMLDCFNGTADASTGNKNYSVHVLTAAMSAQAPADPTLSLALPPAGSLCLLNVEVMPSFTSVDQVAGIAGYVNSYNPGFAAGGGARSGAVQVAVTAQ